MREKASDQSTGPDRRRPRREYLRQKRARRRPSARRSDPCVWSERRRGDPLARGRGKARRNAAPRSGMSPRHNRQWPARRVALRASMAAQSLLGGTEQSTRQSPEAGARRTGSAGSAGVVDTPQCSRPNTCCTPGDRSRTPQLNRSKADRVDSTPGLNIRGLAIGRLAPARAHSASRTHPKPVRAPRAMPISAPIALRVRFQLQQRMRKARPSSNYDSAVIDSTFAQSVHIGGKSTFLDHRRR